MPAGWVTEIEGPGSPMRAAVGIRERTRASE